VQVADVAVPSWMTGVEVAEDLDAGPMIDRGEHPLHEAVAAVGRIGEGQVLRILVPFYPAPMIDTLRGMGHGIHAAESDGAWVVHVRREAKK